MHTMLDIFLRVYQSIRKALWDIGDKISFTDIEISILEQTRDALSPVKLAIETLGGRDSNLITTDAVMQFVLTTLRNLNGDISCKIYRAVKSRFEQRRTIMSSVLQYLHGVKHQDIMFGVSGQYEALEFLVSMLKNLQQLNECVIECQHLDEECVEIIEDEVAAPVSSEMSLKEQMMQAITNAQQLRVNSVRCTDDHLSGESRRELQVRRELRTFDETGIKGPLLQICYDNLLNVAPTSVESERAFSASASICTKVRSRMSDKTLDTLCFLKHHFLKL